MLFHINSEDLGHILSSVAPIADMGATVEQMCVYIEALDSGCVRFSATDMNNSVRHTKSALITEVGTCLVSARKLQALVKTLPSQEVEIKTDGQEVKISCGKIKANIPSLDPSLFDPLVFVDTSCGIEMPFDEFSDIVKSCVKNVATKDDRPAITCVHIHAVDNRLIFTATDSFKVYEGFANCAKPVEFDALVPAVFLSKVAALKAGKTIKFAIDHNQIAFSDGEIEIGSSLNMGK
jgi:DNA polymerase-3 subunit beta